MDEMGFVGKIEQLQGRESDWRPLAELTPGTGEPLRPPMSTLQIVGGRGRLDRAAAGRAAGLARTRAGRGLKQRPGARQAGAARLSRLR
jgi:hypothetical protein